MRSLLEAIKRATQLTNNTIWDRVFWRWLHVDLFTQLAIQKNILDIELEDLPLSNRSNNKKSPNTGHVSDRSKCLIKVMHTKNNSSQGVPCSAQESHQDES